MMAKAKKRRRGTVIVDTEHRASRFGTSSLDMSEGLWAGNEYTSSGIPTWAF